MEGKSILSREVTPDRFPSSSEWPYTHQRTGSTKWDQQVNKNMCSKLRQGDGEHKKSWKGRSRGWIRSKHVHEILKQEIKVKNPDPGFYSDCWLAGFPGLDFDSSKVNSKL